MPQEKQIAQFFGSMDMDTELRYLDTKKGDYPYAENVRIGYSEGQGTFAVENIKSSLLINNEWVGEQGRYEVIGSTEDRPNNFLYYYVCDKIGTRHAIFRYNYLTDTTQLVYGNPVLNFRVDKKIFSSDINSATGELFFTDDFNGIRQINTADAIAGLYVNGLEEFISVERRQPYTPIACEQSSSDATDYTLSLSFQFIYRYVYNNDQLSCWGVPSLLFNTAYSASGQKAIKLTIASPELLFAQQYSKIVSFVDIGFRTSDTGSWYFYKRIPFPNTDGILTDVFYNDKAYAAISQEEITQQYDDVPIRSGSLILAQNRLITGNNTGGYNNPSIQVIADSRIPLAPVLNKMYFNTGSNYGFCLLLFDSLGRTNGAIPLDGNGISPSVSLAVPSRNGPYIPYAKRFGLGGVVPDWVAYYRIGITKSLNKSKFLEAFVEVTSATTEKITFVVNPDFASPTPTSIGWVFTEGDRIALKASNTSGAAFSGTFGDLPLSFDQTTGTYTVSKKDTDLPAATGVILVEFFSPLKQGETQIYYEIPDTYVPVVATNGIRRYGVDYQGIYKDIVIGDGYGDTHYRKWDGATMTIGIEAMSSTEKYYEEWQHNIGRPWIAPIKPPRQVTDTKNMAFSFPLVQNTNINGLSSFSAFNKGQVPIEYGNIKKLVQATDFQINGSVLLVLTDTDAISYYLERQLFSATTGDQTVALAANFLNRGNLLQGGFGTINPESVVCYGGRVYWWDQKRGVICRYSNDGVTPISQQYKAKAFCGNFASGSIRNSGDYRQVFVSAYDPYFQEYLLLMNDVSSDDNKVIAYNEDKNGFSVFYGIQPEWMSTVNQHVAFFKDGQIYIGRKGLDYGTLMGKRLVPKVTSVFNFDKGTNKTFECVYLEAQDKWVPTYVRTQENTRTRTVETSNLPNDGKEQEWDFKYYLRREGGKLDGDKIKGKYLLVDFELLDPPTYLTRLYATACNEEASLNSIAR